MLPSRCNGHIARNFRLQFFVGEASRTYTSRSGVSNTALDQFGSQDVENPPQAAVYLELRPRGRRSRYLRCRQILLEAQPQQLLIGWRKRRYGGFQRAIELTSTQALLRSASGCVDKLAEITRIRDEVNQAPPRLMTVLPVRIFASRPAVLLASMIETDPAGNDDQPCRELAPAVGHIRSESMEIIPLQVVENASIAVHDIVMIAADRAGNVQDEFGVFADKRGPRLVARRWLEMIEKASELGRNRFCHQAPRWRGRPD
jgi:hypothetical protein